MELAFGRLLGDRLDDGCGLNHCSEFCGYSQSFFFVEDGITSPNGPDRVPHLFSPCVGDGFGR